MQKFCTLKYLFVVILLGLINMKAAAQIAAWNNNSLSGTTSGSINATTNNANLNTSVLSRGAGITATSLTGGYASSGWNVADENAAIAGNKYYQCTISANANFKVSLSTLDSKLRRSSTGPNVYIWRYSVDGTNFTDIGSSVSFSDANSSGVVQPQIDLTGISDLQNVINPITITLRLYAWGASAAGGTFSLGTGNVNSLAFGGAVVSTISSNADLSNLSLSAGLLTPAFVSGATSYTASVGNAVSSITVTPTTADVNATVTVNGNSVTSGSPSGSIALNVGSNIISTVVTAQDGITTKNYTVNVTRAAPGVPTITLTSALASFGNVCINTQAGPNSFTIDGSSLDGGNISLAALTGFSYSENSGGPFTATLSFSYSGNDFTGKLIYVQFNPTLVQSYDGNINISGGGVTSFDVAATGSGINAGPSVTTGSSSNVGATTATASGTINATGCTPIATYGIEYSINNGFINGTGTQATSTNLSGGNFSVNLTSLAPNTRYYYKAYASIGTDTSYGIQQFFTNTPLPVLMSAQSGLTFTEDFADIVNWSNFFISGTGANHFGGLSAIGSGGIPNGTTITAATNSFQGAAFGSSGGVQKGTDQVPPTQSIVLLSTGSSSENSSSAAIDFYMDFTGLNAGTLSFDWASVNNPPPNGDGARHGSMRVYTSTDGITFTELTFASVLNMTNGSPTSGTKANIALPASFNNSATARLRFYYHNGTGGATGSRPKISIDNLTVTAVATTPCTSPTAPATALTFGTITDVSIAASFTAASPAVDQYMVVMSTNNSLTGNPVDGQIYNIGDNVGDGSVIAKGSGTGFTATGLTALTTYYFFIFPLNSICTGGPLYFTSPVLNDQATTAAGLPPCAAPGSQPTNLIFGTTTVNSIQASFTSTTADEYLILKSTSSSLSNNPVNGQVYNTGDVIGNGTVVQRNNSTSFNAGSLLPNTQYHFFIFALNSQNCIGSAYNIVSPLNGSQTTEPLPPCATPGSQPTSLTFNSSNTAISGVFTQAANVDDYLTVMSTSSTLSSSPVDNTDYNVNDNIGDGTVISNSSINSFLKTNLTPATTYYFFVFSANKNCSGGTKYLAASPLSGSKTTTSDITNSYYFGTLHSHSDYSDGNKDHPGYTPTDDYTYALTAQCMDYLGISEHNHFSSPDNPGNTITNYHSGPVEANNFTTAHPGFLALYGMEWGVISGGGHVVVYGDGMDNLWGWETGAGNWGASDNYDVYVPKSVYTGPTGLFKTVNDNISSNTFASLAHPNSTDYNNIANAAYDAATDSAIVATAVESGPATSTTTNYSNPGSSMSYLWYYQTLLAKGYHLGPVIDHDNHNTTFGHTTYSRTAIIAPSLTKTEIIKGMRNMHFYATQDCDTKIDFSINTKIMGSVFTDRGWPMISVTLSDATTNLSGAIIRVMSGTPGSGTFAVKIDSVIGPALDYVDQSLANLATAYYYIDVSIGSARIVTAPVWFTRDDVAGVTLPVTLASFSAQKQNGKSLLKWTTAQELNTQKFVVERSTNGSTWQPIVTVAANGNSASPLNYSAIDQNPAKGSNFYRLKIIDIDNKFDYTSIRRVNFDSKYTYSIYPNPVKDILQITVDDAAGLNAAIQVLNMQSQLLINKKTSAAIQPLQLNVSSLTAGIYFLKIVAADGTIVMQKFIKE